MSLEQIERIERFQQRMNSEFDEILASLRSDSRPEATPNRELLMEMAMHETLNDDIDGGLEDRHCDTAFVSVSNTLVHLAMNAYRTRNFAQIIVSFRTVIFLLAMYLHTLSIKTVRKTSKVTIRLTKKSINTVYWLLYYLWRMFLMVLYLPQGIGVGIIAVFFGYLYVNNNPIALFIASIFYKFYQLTFKESVDRFIEEMKDSIEEFLNKIGLSIVSSQFFKSILSNHVQDIATGVSQHLSQQLGTINQALPQLQESVANIHQQLLNLPTNTEMGQVLQQFDTMNGMLETIQHSVDTISAPTSIMQQINDAVFNTATTLAANTLVKGTHMITNGNFLHFPALTVGGTRRKHKRRKTNKIKR